MLRAARAGAVPDEVQAEVTRHLAQNAWSRALVEGMEDGGDQPVIDPVSEERSWARTLVYNAVAWWNWDLATCPKELYETCIGAIQANQQLGLSFHFWSVFYTLGAALEMVPFILVGGLIFRRKSDSLFELLFSLMLVLVGVFGIDYLVDNIFFNHYPMVHPVLHLLATLGSMLLILWYRFPDGRFVPRIFRWLAGLWILILLLSYFFPDTMLNVFTWPDPLSQVINNGRVREGVVVPAAARLRSVASSH